MLKLLPFIHIILFMTTSIVPVLTPEKAENDKNHVQSISETCFAASSFLVKLSENICKCA